MHRVLGPGLLESIYDEALCWEFELRGIAYQRQVAIDVEYKGIFIKGQRVDLIVEREVIIENKAHSKVGDVAMGQLMTYLTVTKLKRGLIINFWSRKLVDGIQRVSM